MIQRKSTGKKSRISVSIDEDDFRWIESLSRPGDSLSYTLSRVIREARLSGLVLFENRSGGIIEELNDWLLSRTGNTFANQLRLLLREFLDR